MRFSIDGIFSYDSHTGEVFPTANAANNIIISHGHYDHIPSTIRDRKVLSSDDTRKMVEHRLSAKKKAGSVFEGDSRDIRMVDAGHTIGSRMFHFKHSNALYTGDFRTIDGYCGKAKPIKCNTLIIEATFADEKFIFPKYESVSSEIVDYVMDNGMTQLHAYPFGKAQELCHLMEKNKIPFRVSETIKKINDVLGLKYKHEDAKSEVFIGRDRDEKYKQVGVSGWAIEKSYRYKMRLDEAFALSDHADYPSMIEFIRKCSPERIFTFHGHSARFAAKLRRAGYNAYPILKNQTILPLFSR
jgi:putative mRNA 3-end processing factor